MALFEILIPTLEERRETFDRLNTRIKMLIGDLPVDIRFSRDNRESTTGAKRNALLQNCEAEYFCFLDDDDDITDEYINWLVKAAKSGMDCASLGGIITFDGVGPRPFYHSIQYDRYFEDPKGYYRPPNHLNLMKTSIGKQFIFPDVTISEDTDWAMQVCNAKALKTEYAIPDIIYYYKYKTKK